MVEGFDDSGSRYFDDLTIERLDRPTVWWFDNCLEGLPLCRQGSLAVWS